MGQKIFFFFRFKEGADREKYKDFSNNIDKPFIMSLPYVSEFDVYVIDNVKKGEFDFDVIEVMETDSWEAWNENYKLPEGERIFALQTEKFCDFGSLTRVLVTKI